MSHSITLLALSTPSSLLLELPPLLLRAQSHILTEDADLRSWPDQSLRLTTVRICSGVCLHAATTLRPNYGKQVLSVA